MDKTDERVAMRRARNLAMSRSAPHRKDDSTRRVEARRKSTSQQRSHRVADGPYGASAATTLRTRESTAIGGLS